MLNIAVVFGGRSVEHEVSVISALQAAASLNPDKYFPVPVYVAKDGTWYSGSFLLDISNYKNLDDVEKRATPVHFVRDSTGRTNLLYKGWRKRTIHIDAVLLGLHGGDGENGAFQGYFESLNLPYTGSGVLGSSLGMDKVTAKRVCASENVPVVPFVTFSESEWVDSEESVLERCQSMLGMPLIVKPARLGSSIGIKKANDRTELDHAIEDAFRYDDRVLVEKAISNLREINCSVLGDSEAAVASVLEEPVGSPDAGVLTFQDKYQRGGDSGAKSGAKTGERSAGMASLDRIIPANISADRTSEIREMAIRIFHLLNGSGVARIDFILDSETDTVYFNEINTIPGSFSFYLWEPTGVPFSELTDRLITLAIKRHRQKNSRVLTYRTNLLSERSTGGLKRKA